MMSHRKWKETKHEPSMLPGPAKPGCCLISFNFLWAIHPIRPVVLLGLAQSKPSRLAEDCTRQAHAALDGATGLVDPVP